MAGFTEWSTTPASNASIGAIAWQEGQLPSTVNNSAREMMSDLAKVGDGTTIATGWHVKANGLGLHDQTDTTKKVTFDTSAVSTGTTRTISYQNAAGTVAFLSDVTSSINSKAAETVAATGDLVPIHSASAGAERKITLGNIRTLMTTGTTTNDNAAAGIVGEYTAGALSQPSAAPLTTAVPLNVRTLVLAAGDWDVTGVVGFTVNGSTTITAYGAWLSLTSATFPWPSSPDTDSYLYLPFSATGIGPVLPAGTLRVSIASPTTVYLTAVCNFAVSTAAAYGHISARRVR